MFKGTKILLLLIIPGFLIPCLSLASQDPASLFRVVIDPGHGGADEGTLFFDHGKPIAEKNITLMLAHELAKQLRAKGFIVRLTRKKDQDVSLPARTALANQIGADIFLSLHVNSTGSGSRSEAEGIETYILNHASDASSRRLARLENSVISKQLGYSPDHADVALILKDLRLDGNLGESKRLACQVQGDLVAATSQSKNVRKRNRGVKQALFHVLLGADMPAILLEAGFLNHPHDRHLLLSHLGQIKMSRAIAKSLDRFRHEKQTSGNLALLKHCRVK